MQYRALSYDFELDVQGHDRLARHLEALFAPMRHAGPDPVHWVVRATENDAAGWELVADGGMIASAESATRMVPEVVHKLNTVAIPRWDGVVCHAGGVARDGLGVVLPAHIEAGKSTLTAGLVRAGFEYVTDEGLAFERDKNLIAPYPKPLSLDPGSWFLFPELEPRAELGDDDYKQEQWQVAPDVIRLGAVADPCPAGAIVFPRYVEGSTTELVSVRRAEALVELAKNTFSFNQQSRFALEQLAAIVRAIPCYRLTVGSLATAVATVEELVSSLPLDAHADA